MFNPQLWQNKTRVGNVQVMPYNWVGRHEFEGAYIDALAPVSNIRLLGCDVSSLDHAHLRIEAIMVGLEAVDA